MAPVPDEHRRFFEPNNAGYRVFRHMRRSHVRSVLAVVARFDRSELDAVCDELVALAGGLPSLESRRVTAMMGRIKEAVVRRQAFYARDPAALGAELRERADALKK